MPYFITDKSPDCTGWATVKEDGEVMGCHTTKQAAIDQMLAVSLAEDMEPGGERALNGELEVGDYVFWDNGGNTMYGEITSISTFGEVTNPLGGSVSASQNTPIATIQVYTKNENELIETQQFVLKGFAPLTKFEYQGQDEMQDDEMQDDEEDSLRIESGPLAVIVDIDGTLISGGRLIEKTYNYIDDMEDTEIFIVTGRNDSTRDATVAELDSLGIDYDRLFMNPGSSAQTPEFKKATAEKLLQEYNVIIAIDNNPANRKVYRELGITALDVTDVPEVPSDENDPDEERSVNDIQNEKWRSIALNLNKDERQSMTTNVERRVNTVEFDIRNGEASSDGMSFTGYAAVFNSPSEPLPFTEVIREGAFKRSLKSRNEIKLFMNHNTDVVLGSTRAGTLKLTEDSRGLLAQAELPDTSAGRDLSVLMKRGDVSSMSFGFSVPPKGDAWSQDGATRELHQVRLHEVSIVTGFPAYEATTASVRSLDILAERTAVDVDALSEAITKLEAGETLEAEHADLIAEVVNKIRSDQPSAVDMLEIKRKQLDLMLKAF